MELPPWGQLPKSQEDPEKIEAAIARLIKNHNDDPEAHTEIGQSLQSHKASEIIDHVAKSIVYDKIKDFEVGVNKLTLNKRIIFFNGESQEGLYLYGDYEIFISLGNTLFALKENSENYAWMEADAEDLPWDLTKPLTSFETIVAFGPISNTTVHIGLGESYGFGFKIKDGKIYAYWRYPQQTDAHEIMSFDSSKSYHFRATRYENTKIEFYIDEALKYTATEDLPEEEEGFPMFFRLGSTDNERKVIVIEHFLAMQDL